MKKKILLDGPRATRSTIKKKTLGLWGRECKCTCLRVSDASLTALISAKWLRSLHSPLRSVQKHQQHQQQKEIRRLPWKRRSFSAYLQREGNCRGAGQLCYRRRCKLLLLSLLFTFNVYPFAIGTDEKWKGGNCFKVAEYSFFSVQVLEDVIWKLCTSGRPKLVWCKTN